MKREKCVELLNGIFYKKMSRKSKLKMFKGVGRLFREGHLLLI